MKRTGWNVTAVVCAFVALTFAHPSAADAVDFGSSADAFLKGGIAQQWFGTLQGMAHDLYISLFIIELIVVGIQGVLHKDNIGEFFQTFVFKVVMATAMIAIIGNANAIFPTVVSLFKSTATQTINSTCSGSSAPANCQSVDDSNPLDLETTFLGWATSYFLAADVSRAADSAESSAAGIMVFGTGLPGLSTAFLLGHANFELFCIALGMICITAAGGILLTYLLLTFECQIIMMIGVFFLAFQGSRFTAQFAQGYMSYCVNIGVKFFVYFFVIAMLKTVTGDASLAGLLGSLAAGAAIPFGAGSIAVVAATSSIPIISVISGILVAAIPNFAGSLLSGSSALSAGAAMGQLTGALASAGQMNAAAASEQKASHQQSDSADAKHELHDGSGTNGHSGAHRQSEAPGAIPTVALGPAPGAHAAPASAARTPATQAPGAHASGVAPQRESTWHVGGNAYGATAPAASNAPLAMRSPDEIKAMRPTEVYDAAQHSDWGDLSDAQKNAISSDPALRDAATRSYDAKERSAKGDLNGAASTSFLTSLRGAAPPPEGPPSAVQIRVTNPDKL